MRRARLLRACVVLALAAAGAAVAPAVAPASPGVIVAFLQTEGQTTVVPPGATSATNGSADTLLHRFAASPGLGIGLMSATQGNYTEEQAMLDMSQGTRISASSYDPTSPPPLNLVVAGGAGRISGWASAVKRAKAAPATIRPGLLASAIPSGVAYVGIAGARNIEAVLAADRAGRISVLSLGPAATVSARALALSATRRLVVASLPPGGSGWAQAQQLLAARAPDGMVILVQRPPDVLTGQLLPTAVAAQGFAGRGLKSESTRRDGVVAGIDVLPTVLDHLGIAVPDDVRGEPIRATRRLDAAHLIKLRTRWESVAPRRIPTLLGMVMAWAGLLLFLGLWGWHRHFRRGLRVGALAFLWLPASVLAGSALSPGTRVVEMAVIVVVAFGLGALTDRFVGWPRGPIVPVAVALFAFTLDLALGSRLTTDSLLGSNPRAGVRFFGIGNELEAILPTLAFVAVAAALTGRGKSRGGAWAFALAGAFVAIVAGYGRLGADVGGVITATSGAAAATIMMLPGGVTRRAVVLGVVTPFASVALLALLDKTTGGNGHFTRSVLDVEGSTNLIDIFKRRVELAGRAARRGLMPAVTAGAALAAVFAVRNREWLYAPLRDAAWTAALIGGLTSGIVGALTNDSGPILFVAAMFVLACTTAYIQGDPSLTPASGTADGEPAHTVPPSPSSTLGGPASASALPAARVP